MDFKEVINAWQIAANDLNLKIQAPFVLTTSDNKTIQFELLIDDFGSKMGTIVTSIEDMSSHHIPEQNGLYCSALNVESYKAYNRQHFIDTLNDWGYFGDSSKQPKWYTGQSWS